MNKNNPFAEVGRVVRYVVLAVVVLITLLNSFYTNKEQEQAVVTTFGIANTVKESGLHFKVPFIQKVKKVDTTIKGVAIGYDEITNESREEESLMITSDFNFVDIDFFLEYKVSDPVKSLYNSEQPELILKNIAQSCIRNVVGSYSVDEVLTTGKNEIQGKIRENIQSKLELHDIGLSLVNVTIQDANPPTEEVMEAFKAVETAKQGKDTAINNANKYKNEKLPEMEAEADRIVQEAAGQKEQRINEATAAVERFNQMYQEYAKNPAVTRTRMFYEAMEDILPDLKVIIDSGDGSIQKFLPMESFASVTTTTTQEGTANE